MSTSSPTPDSAAWRRQSHTERILATMATIQLIALIMVILRLYTRRYMVKALGVDDLFVCLAMVCAIGDMVCSIIQAGHGLGKHSATLSPNDLTIFSLASFCQTLVSPLIGLGLLKISIAVFVMRLVSTTRWARKCLWALIVFVIAYTIMAICTILLYCVPIAGFWNAEVREKGHCYNIHIFIDFAIINTSFNISTDLVLAALPSYIVWHLQMVTRTRISLVIILSLGYFAVAFGIAKAYYQFAFAKSTDLTFNSSVPFWGFIQFQTGTIAACAPTLKPLMRNFIQFTSRGYRYPTATNTYSAASSRGRGFHTSLRPPGAVRLKPYSGSNTSRDQSTAQVNETKFTSHVVSVNGINMRSESEERILEEA